MGCSRIPAGQGDTTWYHTYFDLRVSWFIGKHIRPWLSVISVHCSNSNTGCVHVQREEGILSRKQDYLGFLWLTSLQKKFGKCATHYRKSTGKRKWSFWNDGPCVLSLWTKDSVCLWLCGTHTALLACHEVIIIAMNISIATIFIIICSQSYTSSPVWKEEKGPRVSLVGTLLLGKGFLNLNSQDHKYDNDHHNWW